MIFFIALAPKNLACNYYSLAAFENPQIGRVSPTLPGSVTDTFANYMKFFLQARIRSFALNIEKAQYI